MNQTKNTARQVKRFETPVRIEQKKDRFGCVGFTSYGFIQNADGTADHVKNPDFNWKQYGL